MIDVRVYRGAEINTDHLLFCTKVVSSKMEKTAKIAINLTGETITHLT
jgi:ribosomal protein S17